MASDRFYTPGMFALSKALCVAVLALAVASCGSSSSSSNDTVYSTTEAYVEQFYPLWFTYYQSQYGTTNRLVGPATVSPIYQIVVAINVDTLYVSSFVDLSSQPVVLTIPSTPNTYSILTLDPYGDIFQTAIQAQTPGTYALTGPGWNGTLPAGVTQIPMPLNFTTLIFRVDNYSASGVDQTTTAAQFRSSLLMQTLSNYISNPSGGAALILPELAFAVPFKTAADALMSVDPITFLSQLQVAVASSNTPPLSADEQTLSNTFNSLFNGGNFSSSQVEAEFFAGAQAAYNAIIQSYVTATGPNNWITFTNIGDWGDNVVQRSAISEFIQYANNHGAAAYYQAFVDGSGNQLNGGTGHTYVMTFAAGQQPQASRFWSVTAYTPNSIELISNPANKYAVASYTPGLQTNSDGSLSIYMSPTQPTGVPAANWLPVPTGQFNVMLRVYGPQGSVLNNTYVPPPID